jgi:purine catabolism regulator
MASVTVYDILRLALPPGTQVVAGSAGISHQVTWVAAQRATLPLFADLRGGELALLSIEATHILDPRLTLATLVKRLAQAPVSALAILGDIQPEAVQAAESVRLPLLRLPSESDLREVQREVERLISDYEAQLERRGAQLYNLLTQRSLEGYGVAGLIETLAERTGRNVAYYAANGDMRLQHGQGQGRVALQSLRPNAQGDNSLLNQDIWVEPVGTANYPNGYLALAGSKLDEWDRLAAVQGSAALAIEFAKEHAVQAAEDRLRGDFLSTILAGPPADPAALYQRGNELGYDLNQPYVAMLCALPNASGAELSRVLSSIQSELTRRNITAPLLRREASILCMLPLAPSEPRSRDLAEAMRDRMSLAEALRERLSTDYPGITLALGTPAPTLADWTRTLREAEQALSLGQQLFAADRVLAFGDLGVYRLLVLLRDSPELWTFYRETLAPLVNYDTKNNQPGELIKTLEAYFNHLGNLRATSESLHVHRNTLLYRLERIEQISGLDMSNADEHFALWLALRVHRVLSSTTEGYGDM